jgi:hypothetical protein
MKVLKIENAIALQNARRKIKNEEQGRPSHYKVMTKANLGRLIFPNGNFPRVQMSNMLKSATINPDHFLCICEATEVDPNFLFGFASVNDKDYQKLVVEAKNEAV